MEANMTDAYEWVEKTFKFKFDDQTRNLLMLEYCFDN